MRKNIAIEFIVRTLTVFAMSMVIGASCYVPVHAGSLGYGYGFLENGDAVIYDYSSECFIDRFAFHEAFGYEYDRITDDFACLGNFPTHYCNCTVCQLASEGHAFVIPESASSDEVFAVWVNANQNEDEDEYWDDEDDDDWDDEDDEDWDDEDDEDWDDEEEDTVVINWNDIPDAKPQFDISTLIRIEEEPIAASVLEEDFRKRMEVMTRDSAKKTDDTTVVEEVITEEPETENEPVMETEETVVEAEADTDTDTDTDTDIELPKSEAEEIIEMNIENRISRSVSINDDHSEMVQHDIRMSDASVAETEDLSIENEEDLDEDYESVSMPNAPKTGDSLDLGALMALIATMILGTVGLVVIIRRKLNERA